MPSGARRWRKSKHVFAIGAALCVLVSLIGAYFVNSAASSLRRRAAADRAQTAQEIGDWRLGLSVKLKAREWERKLAAAKAALPYNEDQPGFVADMTSLASACGVAWSSSSWSGGGELTGGLSSWGVQISVDGTEAGVLCVIERLGQLPRAVSVSSVILNWSTFSQVQAGLQLTVYARSEAGKQ